MGYVLLFRKKEHIKWYTMMMMVMLSIMINSIII